jgi:D-psicose/D-tagatose/L-ribulose 3-epimerase
VKHLEPKIQTEEGKVKVGFNMLLWTAHVSPEHERHFEALKGVGYEGVEVPVLEGAPDHYAALGRILDRLGLERTAISIIPSAQVNPIGEGAQEGAVKHLSWAIECSQALGSPLLAGPLHSTLGQLSGSAPTIDERKRGIDTHRMAGDIAKRHGIKLCLEPLNRFECYFLNTMDDLSAYLDEVAHPNVSGMYDTFHANIEEKNSKEAIARNARHISHVHISDNDRGTPGRGHIDMRGQIQALRAAGYDGWFVIEAFGRALPAVAAAARVWRDFFPTPDQVWQEGISTIRKGWDRVGDSQDAAQPRQAEKALG